MSLRPLTQRVLLIGSLGALLLVLASGGLAVFQTAEWFSVGKYPPGWEGYDKGQFTGLVYFTVCLPVAFALLFSVFQHFIRVLAPRSVMHHVFALLVSILFCLVGLIFGIYWASNFIECMGIGCLNEANYKPFDPPKPEAGWGWQIIVGMSLFLSMFGISIALVCSFIYRRLRVTDFSMDNQALLSPTTTPFRHSLRREWTLYFIFIALLILFGFFTTYIPDNWEYFTADRIAQTAHQRIDTTPDGSNCANFIPTCDYPNCNFPLYICPELPGATFTTISYQLQEYWTIKIYPSNLFFYLFLILTSFCAMLVRSVKVLHTQTRRKFYLRPFKMFISVGEVLVFLALSTLIILWVHYWAVDHNYNGYWPGPAPFKSEVVSRCLGQIAVMFMSLLMVPAARDSVFSLVFGVSWEAGIKYHRWLGVLFLLSALGHMFANWAWYADLGAFPQDIIDVPMHVQFSIDNFTVPLVNIIFWVTLVCIGLFGAFEYFRRNHFELFYYAHHVSFSALIPAVLWHAASGWEFLLPGVALWFLDRTIRIYRSAKPVQVLSITALNCQEAGRITEIRCQRPFDYFPGQYCFVNIAEISLLEWHPFTISTSASTEISFHIKDMGPNTFTGRLHDAAAAMNSLTVAVDGPYGVPIDFNKYKVVLLVAGGIGITPVKSIFESLRENPPETLKTAHMVWVARDVSLLRLMDNTTQDLPLGPFSAALYLHNPAQVKQSLNPNIQGAVPLNTHVGRPNIPLITSEAVGAESPDNVLLFVCGPPGISAICERTANEQGWHFHTETFAL